MLAKLERQARYVFEHKPRELRIAVNGNFQGTLKVNSDLNQIDLAVADKEPVEFIEIYSEQQLRLLFLNFDSSLPHSKANVTHTLSFSDERYLVVNVGFSAQGAEISLSYQDPTYKQVEAILENRNIIDAATIQLKTKQQTDQSTPSFTARLTAYFFNLISLISFGWRRFTFAALTVLIATGGWMFFEHQSGLSAKAILEEAEKKKLNWQYQPDKILYWEEEEKLQNSSKKYFSKRWANNRNGQHERLILRYDEQQKLIWGKWIKADGAIILYDGKNETATISPSMPMIKEKLPSVNREHLQILQKHIAVGGNKIESEQQIEFQTNWMIKHLTSESVKTHKISEKETICVVVKANGNPDEKVRSTELEVDYDKDTFQRILYRYQINRLDGTTAVEEARLITAREVNLDEFENNDLTRFLAAGRNIKTYSVEEFAEKLKSVYVPAKK